MTKILILGAGIEQTIPIKLAKNMGLKVIAVDGNIKALGLRLANVGISDDIKNVDRMVDIGKRYEVNGVFAHGVEIPEIVAQVAKKLNLPGIDPKVAENATNKLKRIKCFKEKNILCPKFLTAKNIEEAGENAEKIGFPCVFKPVDNAGARGVIKVRSKNEIENGFKEATRYSNANEILIEEFLEGLEISTESVIYENKIFTTGFGDRNYTRRSEFEPFFVEDGHNVPSSISTELKEKVIKTVEGAINALTINWGVAKGDILIKDEKVYVLEIAARTSGGWFCAGTVPIATGVNILSSLIKMSVGYPLDENELKPKFNKAACQRYIIPTQEGIFERIGGIDKAKKMPGVKMFTLFNNINKGDLVRKATNHSERFGQIITQGENIEDAIKKCENAMKTIQIVVRE
ncbi:ATP-grasp domain-containing protein [Methanobacterium formicicum]|uniref:Phosphoribosylglycinamide synthetase n=1 Tax=Methanobacterium formicicum (strain DSM 3637 / PP1) TaxID=1204725 RepID=K2QDC8_METFP|nr:ATP-grasp domain-containing protein [Methanobacterium formicicum]EKF86031.1 phosphoribosylglycinamide synthetase [Methanobacterium formicicum DSM 3637]